MEFNQAHVGKLEAQLKRWGSQLDGLVAKAQEAGTEAKDDYRKAVADLRAKHQAAQAKLEELRTVGADKWDGFKGGVESAWSELETAFKRLTH